MNNFPNLFFPGLRQCGFAANAAVILDYLSEHIVSLHLHQSKDQKIYIEPEEMLLNGGPWQFSSLRRDMLPWLAVHRAI